VLLQVPQNSECATLIGGARPAAPSVVAAQETLEAAVHDPGVRVPDEAVGGPLLRSRHEALRPCELEAREYAIEAGPAQVEVVNVRAVVDDKAVRRSCLECPFLPCMVSPIVKPGLMTSVRPNASHFPTRSDIHPRGLPDAARSLKPARWVKYVDFSTSGCADAS
jgi:hypothetical protein